MRILCVLALGLLISASGVRAATIDLDIDPDPNTTYIVSLDLDISDVLAFLASLGLGDGIQLVDGDGNVLDELTGVDLAELLEGLTGALQVPVQLVYAVGDIVPDDLKLLVPDIASLDVTNVTVTQQPQQPDPDAPPTVKVKKRKVLGNKKALLKGIARDDRGVNDVVLRVSGSGKMSANGTDRWKRRVALKGRKTNVRVFAVDTAGQRSVVKRVVLRTPNG